MRVLVTGAGGFLGKYICDRLKENNHEIVGLLHSKDKNVDFGVEYIQMDISKKDQFKKKLNNQYFDAVIHNAAYVTFEDNNNNFRKLFNVNVQGTLNVLNYSIQSDVENLVYSSSVSVYENKSGLISETTNCLPSSYYGMSKLMGELLCKKYQQDNDLNCSIFRYGGIYGYDARHNISIMNFINNIMKSEEITLFNENSFRNYLYVKDAAFANLFGIENKLEDSYNIVTDETLRILEMVNIITDLFEEYNPKVSYSHDNVENNVIYDVQKFKAICKNFPQYSFEEAIKDIKLRLEVD